MNSEVSRQKAKSHSTGTQFMLAGFALLFISVAINDARHATILASNSSFFANVLGFAGIISIFIGAVTWLMGINKSRKSRRLTGGDKIKIALVILILFWLIGGLLIGILSSASQSH